MTEKYVPTTTHGTWGSGRPRLIVSADDEHQEVLLEADRVRIGSSDGVEIRLEGLDALHAEIHHDAYDEYVLVLHGAAETSGHHVPIESLDGVRGQILRSGSRFVLAGWAFVFARDEFADHGIPFGGRQGGEGAHDRKQPGRPDYTGQHPVIATDAQGRAVGPVGG